MPRPFHLFPWDKSFLPEVVKYIAKVCDNDLERVSIIMPHSRPRRYLTELLSTHMPRPCFLPRMLTIKETMTYFDLGVQGLQKEQKSCRMATELDGVYLLYKTIEQLRQGVRGGHTDNFDASSTFNAFARLDLAHFLPWGLRLFALFEECMQQLSPVHNIAHTEDEVSPVAAELLAALGDIFTCYLDILDEEGFTTEGLNALRLATALQSKERHIPLLLQTQSDINQHVFLIGFNALNHSEEVLLKVLWQEGAHILIHSDPQLAKVEGGEHFACQEHAMWLKRWKATCELAVQPSGNKAHMHFIAAHDVHSQLLALQEKLQTVCTPLLEEIGIANDKICKEQATAAVVLTSPSLLVPTLHHLPSKIDFNVSMGYPLEKSALFSLIELLMLMQEQARFSWENLPEQDKYEQNLEQEHEYDGNAERLYPWRLFLQCLRHPFVQMLAIQDIHGENARSIQAELAILEKIIRKGQRFVSIEGLMRSWQLHAFFTADSLPLLQKLFTCLVEDFAKISTAMDLGDALYNLCQLLLSAGTEAFERYAFDAESMYRLVNHVIPALKFSCLAQEPLAQSTLFALCRQCIKAERVPFEADPITGLQILGMLETRLLHFENVFVLDAIDNALPGFSPTDPLLPESLRTVLGLPALQERENVVAHTLHRLLASAKHVYFYWQEGSPGSELLDNKKSRSRFVDSYLWEEEKQLGRIIEKNQAPLFTVPCPIYPFELVSQSIKVNSALREKINNLLTKGISPSKLNDYLSCPLRFAWQHLYAFKPPEEVNEGDDHSGVGKFLHEVLQIAFRPWLSKKLKLEELSLEYLMDVFKVHFDNSELQITLSAQRKMFLQMAVPLRLENFWEAQKKYITAGFTHIELLESELSAPISGYYGENFCIKGIVDRVDRREQHLCNKTAHSGLLVLDYKTGKNVTAKGGQAFMDMQLFTDINAWTPNAENMENVATKEQEEDLFTRVGNAFPSLQLPAYLYLCKNHYGENAHILDAAFISLAVNGDELYFMKNIDFHDRQMIINTRINEVLSFVVRHLQCTEEFLPKKSESCKHCPYTLLCQKSV